MKSLNIPGMIETLQRGWRSSLANLFGSAENELTIASPYISQKGSAFLIESLPKRFCETGTLNFISDLSPQNVGQGATDPHSFRLLFDSVASVRLYHLRRLHAKVYLRDGAEAIVTSGNLTDGGVFRNFEYGLRIDDADGVRSIRKDLLDYATLGVSIDRKCIDEFCSATAELRAAYLRKEQSASSELENRLKTLLISANDTLLAKQLGGKSLNAIFKRTVIYLLRKHGPLSTVDLHDLVQQIHPDLCDDSIDRVIEGVRFGKKWKHAVRSAEWDLKYKGAIDKENGRWSILDSNARTYWLKQIGSSTRPVAPNWNIADSEGRLHFSKRPRGVLEDDVLLVFAVQSKKLVSVYKVVSEAFETSEAEFVLQPWKRRWPWYVRAEVQTPHVEQNWARQELTYDYLSERFFTNNPKGMITPSGSILSGNLLRGRDKLRLTPEFGAYVWQHVNEIETRQVGGGVHV